MVKKIVFLVPALSQPRCIKRVRSIHNMRYVCDVYGYKRGKYDINEYPKEINVNVINSVQDGNYFNKAIKVWKDLSRIVTTNKENVVAFYAFGFFQAFVCAIKGVKYIYEISDVFYAYPHMAKFKWLLKIIDKLLIRKSALTVMTSGGFQEYFNMYNNNILIIPNKVSESLLTIQRQPLCNLRPLRFGFVGSIRYESIFRFAETIGEYYPNIYFDFYGSAVFDIKTRIDNLITQYHNVRYHGVYKNPEDLERIYSNIDVVVACYDVNSENEQIAEPNKLYEALYFCRPIIVSDGIYLAKRVKELNCGFTINATSKDGIRKFIDQLTIDQLIGISETDLKCPISEIVNDSNNLNSAIKSFVDIS